MAFPETPLGLRVETRMGLVWTDITSRVKLSEPIVHTRGIRQGSTLADPATVPLKIDNKDGAFSTRNPMSPFDGLFGLNTPVRMWLPDGPHFLDLDGDPANYVSTPDTPALDITGDLDIRSEVDVSWFAPTANQVLLAKWEPGQRSYSLRVYDQMLTFNWSADGTTNLFASRPLPALPSRAVVRATLDVDDGSGQFAVRLYWAETIDADEWTQIGADNTGPATAVHSGTAPLRVGGYDPTVTPPRTPFTGKGYRFEVRSGIDGTVVASPDFEAQPIGTAGFTDSAGRVWSYSGNATVADRQDVFYGEISNWPQRWSPSEKAVWTPVQASGIVRRLGQGSKPLDSTLRRRIPSGNPDAYWPFEEDTNASRAYSPITGVSPAAVTGVEWAAVDTLPSSKALPRLTAAATLSAIVPDTASDGQWQVEFVYNADDKAPSSAVPHAEVISISTTGTIRRWVIGMRAGNVRIWGFDASGTDIIFRSINVGGDVFHGWVRMRIWARDNGDGTLGYFVIFQDVGGDAGGLGGTETGTAGRVTAVTANWGALTEGWAFGHLSVLPTANSSLYTGSDDAYSGETAWERLRRLAGEQGVPMARVAGELTPERVGPQRVARLLEVFQDAADADGGLLLEDRTRLGLVYRDRSSMYTQEPALTLVYKTPPLAPPLEPDDDADVTRNDRTVKRDGGSEARAILREGRLSVQDPPDGIGLYDDSFTLSLADDTQAEPIAYWLLHLGTYDGARYPAVTIRLHRAPDQIPQVLKVREGDLIRIKDLPGFVAFGDVDLIVMGWKETVKPRTWERTFTCEPGGPWNTAVADHTVYGKAGTDGSRLAAAVTADATSLPVRATAVGLPWVAANPVLNANSDFATGLAPWSPFDSAIERIPKPADAPFRGDWVMEITPNGVGQFPNAGSEQIPIVPGLDYVLSGWLHCAVSRNVALNANWFNVGFGYVTTSANDQAVIAGVWTWFEATFTAPVGTAYVNLSPTVPNFPPSTDVLLAAKVTWRRAGGMPREFPIDVQVGGEVAAVNAITPSLVDSFARTTSPGWGTPDIGAAWVASGGAGGDHYTQGAEAAHLLTGVDVPRLDLSPVAGADHDVLVSVATFALATGGPQLVSVVARAADGDNCYMAQLSVSTSQTITLTLRKRVAGVETELATVTTSLVHSAFAFFRLRLQVIGAELKARVWPAGGTEPVGWQVTATDSSLTTGGNVGCRSVRQTANTNAALVVAWDNVQLLNPQAFRVARSQNGVVKAQVADAPVRLAFPAIAPL
ncbi:hypothetical protein OG478_22810 [Streptomyces phaeochromogenes]|uniref:hypothetical protein n=1 Tax=Streptomyces phaeochromogenes TaxID=1923 RepID=UPI00386DD56D|nr:hypothetical protein OG478_22810 [Streptomyces phaeochromogenes]